MSLRTLAVHAQPWLAAAALTVAAILPAHAQDRADPVSELVRKADAREPDNGFCAAITDWPAGTGGGYVLFLRSAAIGYAKVNRFRNNMQCQFDRVVDVYNGSTGKCVRYLWWACATGSSCARGEDTECLQADGSWKRQAK
jgi:hypothetical protein